MTEATSSLSPGPPGRADPADPAEAIDRARAPAPASTASTGSPPGTPTAARRRFAGPPAWVPRSLLWALRVGPVVAFLPLLSHAQAVVAGRPGALHALDEAAPNQLGTAALATLLASFAVTPVATLTGWRWHLPLRRDLGLWAFGLGALDGLISAAANGLIEGTAGKAFLATGTGATLLLLPLAVTSNKRSQRTFGRDWKRLHRLVYPSLVLIGAHLYLMTSDVIVPMVQTVVVLIALRLGPVRRRVVQARKALIDRLNPVVPVVTPGG